RPQQRATLAGALAAVWTRLEPTEAAAHARRAAADLEDAIRDARTTPIELYMLANALAAVYAHLGPAERAERATIAADALLAALRRSVHAGPTIILLSDARAALCVHLDRAGAVRVADALLAVWGDPDVRRSRAEFREEVVRKLAARLDEPDLQRLLDHPL